MSGPDHGARSLVRRRPVVAAAAVVLVVLVVVSLAAPLLAPYDPDRGDFGAVFQHPNGEHWLGTDASGRDLLSRLIFGARTSLVAAVIATGTSVLLGVPFGLLAAYASGLPGRVIGQIFDALQSVPPLILALALVAVLGPGLGFAMLAVGIVFTPRCYRVTRAATLELRRTTFIEAEVAVGMPPWRILGVHVLLNVLSPLSVVVSISLGTAILAEASLSFLGLGVEAPTASWGQMLQAAFQRLDLPYLAVPAGLAVLAAVAAFTVVGDAIRQAVAGTAPDGGRG